MLSQLNIFDSLTNFFATKTTSIYVRSALFGINLEKLRADKHCLYRDKLQTHKKSALKVGPKHATKLRAAPECGKVRSAELAACDAIMCVKTGVWNCDPSEPQARV